ncbi:hypothetical protein OSTOST_25194, partial [Ostertagia ostertagi]
GSYPSFQVVQEQNRVQVIGESQSVYGKVNLSALHLNQEELLARKIDGVIALLKSMDPLIASRLFIEIACKSVRMWDDTAEKQDTPRFISQSDLFTGDSEFRRTSSTLSLVCFSTTARW